MKKLLFSLIATLFFAFTVNSLSAQEKSPVKKDTTEKSKKPAMPLPDSTIPNPDTPIPIPEAPERPVVPEKTKPQNPTLPQVPDAPPPAPLPKAPEPKSLE